MIVGLREGPKSNNADTRRRSPLRRFSLGHVAVLLAALLAFVANLAFLRSQDDSTTVVVAARTIAAGDAISRDDLSTTRLQGDPALMSTLLTSLEGLEGRVARRALAPGELVGSADLLTGPAPGGLASMAIPIDPAHAAGGIIRPGDRVDIVDVDSSGAAVYVVRDAPVLSVSEERIGALAGAGGRHLVVGLSSDQVLVVAEAIADEKVDVIVTTGTASG